MKLLQNPYDNPRFVSSYQGQGYRNTVADHGASRSLDRFNHFRYFNKDDEITQMEKQHREDKAKFVK